MEQLLDKEATKRELKPYLNRRPRRNRISPMVRNLVRETILTKNDLVAPLFVREGENIREEVASMPGVYRYSLDELLKEVEACAKIGIPAINLFSVVNPRAKDLIGSESYNSKNILHRAITAIKREIPEITVMCDVALDPYTTTGQDGIVVENGTIDNDLSIEALGKMTLSVVSAGADIVAPSDMMDGRVAYLRELLDQSGHIETGILSYTAKYASSFYGPFRDALESAPKGGDKKTYQMDPANREEAILEAILDVEEGADMLMVKPAIAYLDVIVKMKEHTHLPIAAYQVSGEYSMIQAAGNKGWIDASSVWYESLVSIKRAGADFIFAYNTREIPKLIEKFRE